MTDKKKVTPIKLPAPKASPESVLKALNNTMEIKCKRCKKPLDLNNIKYVNGRKGIVTCISCGVINKIVRTIFVRGLAAAEDGSLRRTHPKKKLSKKDRKRQRAIEKGWS